MLWYLYHFCHRSTTSQSSLPRWVVPFCYCLGLCWAYVSMRTREFASGTRTCRCAAFQRDIGLRGGVRAKHLIILIVRRERRQDTDHSGQRQDTNRYREKALKKTKGLLLTPSQPDGAKQSADYVHQLRTRASNVARTNSGFDRRSDRLRLSKTHTHTPGATAGTAWRPRPQPRRKARSPPSASPRKPAPSPCTRTRSARGKYALSLTAQEPKHRSETIYRVGPDDSACSTVGCHGRN